MYKWLFQIAKGTQNFPVYTGREWSLQNITARLVVIILRNQIERKQPVNDIIPTTRIQITSMAKLNKQNNFIYLTIALISVLLGASLTQTLHAGVSRHIINVLTIIMSVVAVNSLKLGSRWPLIGWTITGSIVVTVLLNSVFGWKQTDYIQLTLMLVLFFGITVSTSKQVLLEGSIDANKITGSVALFILLGLIWTVLYLLTIEFDPRSFNGITKLPWAQNFSQVSYFSFVTLTTLGFGDISPATRFAEFLVYFEAIFGVFYIAIFVAGLISVAQPKTNGR